MNWSPAKKARQKRSLEAIETDEESVTYTSEDEEEEGEPDANGKQETGEKNDYLNWDRTNVEARSRGAGNEGQHHQALTLQGAEGAHRSAGPMEQNHSISEEVTTPTRKGGAADTRSPSSTRGLNNFPEKRRNKPIVSAPTQSETSPAGKHNRGGKIQRVLEKDAPQTYVVMDTEGSMVPNTELPLISRPTYVEVIPETQIPPLQGNSKVYKDILASIGLDSPTSSHGTRGNLLGEELRRPQDNTPIRNSAASLIALGKHIFTPRQGRSWESRNKSPLGVNQSINPNEGSNVDGETMKDI